MWQSVSSNLSAYEAPNDVQNKKKIWERGKGYKGQEGDDETGD